MTLDPLVGIAFAAVAAVALNTSYLVQHAGLVTAPEIRMRQPLATLAGLLHSRRWVAGAALGYGGLAIESGALLALPVSTVQAIIAAGIVVVVIGARRVADRSPTLREAAAAALTVVALVLLALVAPPPGHRSVSPAAPLAVWALLSVGGATLLLACGDRGPGRLGLAAGALYGTTTIALDAFLVAVSGSHSSPGIAAEAILVGVVSVAGGFFAFQRGLQTGVPVAVVTVMTAATNVGAIAGGLIVTGDPLAAPGVARAVQVLALALAAGAAALVASGLARSPGAVRQAVRAPSPAP